jgi:hypothetical protein
MHLTFLYQNVQQVKLEIGASHLMHFQFNRFLNRFRTILRRLADPHHFNADSDPTFNFNVGQDPDPAPHQGDANFTTGLQTF